MVRERFFIATSVLMLAAAQPAAAQVVLTGVVADSTSSPISLAVVTLSERRVITDETGRFRFDDVLPGAYVIQIRRIGFAPRDLPVTVAGTGANAFDIGTVALELVPIRLADLTVETLAPIMTERGVREFNFARRQGVSRHFFTAYEIERLRPFDVSDLVRRVPGARRAEDQTWGSVVQLPARSGGFCTAAVVVDGVRTSNPNPDLFTTPDRIGGMWVGQCEINIWTKPSAGPSSPFVLGMRLGFGEFDREVGVRTVGGFVAFPIFKGRAAFVPGFDRRVGRGDMDWQFKLDVRTTIPTRASPWYVGAGIAYQNFSQFDVSFDRVVPVLLTGIARVVGHIQPYLQFEAYGPARDISAQLSLGLAYVHY